jgi:hypothetical protein
MLSTKPNCKKNLHKKEESIYSEEDKLKHKQKTIELYKKQQNETFEKWIKKHKY